MAREVTHEETGPRIVDEDEFEEMGNVAICQCGLADSYPFCDGSHQVTEDEQEGIRYKYENDDAEGPRHEIAEVVFTRDE